MASYFYIACLIISTASLVYMSQKKYKQHDKYLGALLLLIPIVNLGYWIVSSVHTPEAAMIAYCFIYLDSTVILVILLFSLINNLNIDVPRWIKLTVYVITAIHLFTIWVSRNSNLYYSSITLEESSLGTSVRTVDGPLKFTHYIYLALAILAIVVFLIIGFLRRTNESRKSLFLYAFASFSGILIYLIEKALRIEFSVLPALYAMASVVIVLNYEHVQSHDIYNLIGERQAKHGLRGFCAFDMKRCLMGYNNQLTSMLPDILNVKVDECIPDSSKELSKILYGAIDGFISNGDYSEKISVGSKTYQILVSEFSVENDKKPNGHLVEIADITEEQNKLDIIEKYNEKLSEEVTNKTNHILDIQNSVVLGLANMVENRDNSTGNHVKRTSDVIKFLVEEIQRQKAYPITKVQAKDIIRAAPMHDLGKISIDSAILCKPGKLSDDEFAIMKTHAPKSAEIVKIILEGVEEQHFVDISYNLARHHHERWDGRGYPDGLMGENIPVEARIMAVADVYDALVSKRCYKEALSFDKAFKIMNECMGSQFDPAMRPVFVACRNKLEAYYTKENNT